MGSTGAATGAGARIICTSLIRTIDPGKRTSGRPKGTAMKASRPGLSSRRSLPLRRQRSGHGAGCDAVQREPWPAAGILRPRGLYKGRVQALLSPHQLYIEHVPVLISPASIPGYRYWVRICHLYAPGTAICGMCKGTEGSIPSPLRKGSRGIVPGA